MPQRKPKVGPYELPCEPCWRLGRLVVFTTIEALNDHLRKHFVDALPDVKRIIAIA